MVITRRTMIVGGLAAVGAAAGAATLAWPETPEIQATPDRELGDDRTRVYVLGTIHSNHRTSRRYSLDVLREAFRRSQLNRLLAEIPPDRIAEAYRGFEETGEVTEPRTRVFPEYTDVAFPLLNEMDFEIVGAAGWTQAIADFRAAELERLSQDPTRAEQWAEYQAASRESSRALRGRSDDPLFIHTPEYDSIIERGRQPYQDFFDQDLGAAGWTQINDAHVALINAALDDMSGNAETALVTFGTAHKYKILQALEMRDDIQLLDARELFV